MPRVTVVTPSYNQAAFLEDTIRSVLLQGYPNLEYIIVDGGSTDGSVDIIRRYESHLSWWVSEPDRGHCHAVNKGWQRATGDIVAFLNSDDVYLPGAIAASVAYLQEHPDQRLVYGHAYHVNEQGEIFNTIRALPFDLGRLVESCFIVQPTVFVRRSLLDDMGLLDESLRYSLDYEYWLRAAVHTPMGRLGRFSAAARYHSQARSPNSINQFYREEIALFDRIFKDALPPFDDPTLRRRAYLPRLLFMSGLNAGFTDDERAKALARLREIRPSPTTREIAAVIVEREAWLGTPYAPASGTGRMNASDAPAVDYFGILPSLREGGIIGQDPADRARRLLHGHASLRAARSDVSLTPTQKYRALARAALSNPELVTARYWWSTLGKSTPLGRGLLPAYYRLRDSIAWARGGLHHARSSGKKVRVAKAPGRRS